MTAINKIEKQNKIEEQDFDEVIRIMFHSFLIDNESENLSSLEKKEILLDSFSNFLDKYLTLKVLNNKEAKLKLINFIDKINMQKELLELEKEEINLADIKIAAKRLGRKSQSAFKTK